MNLRNLCLASLAAATLAGCSSGGGGGTAGTAGSNGVAAAVTAGTSSVVADKVSIIDTSSNSAGKAVAMAASLFASTADWNKDKSSTYINDRATGAFNNVNEILCMMSQTGYVAMAASSEAAAVPYKALVNKNLCKGNDSTSNASQSQQGDTSASSAPDYTTWTVKSFLNASKQLEAHVWIFEKKSSDTQSQGPDALDKIITAKLVVTSTKDEVPPNGVFRIDFKGYQATAAGQPDTTKPVFAGLLESKINATTGKPEIRFADAENSGKFSEAATVIKTSDTTGYGKVSESDSFNGGSARTFTADFGFDANFFRRSTDDNGTTKDLCFDRAKFETSTWRYGLYSDADGSRYVKNSGIPFNTAADGSGMYGWAGYYGVWAPDNSKITDGMSLYSKDPTSNNSVTYTLNLFKGKLKKHTQHTTTLSAIQNIPLEGYMEGSTQYRVIWDGIKLAKTAWAPQSMGGPPVWTPLDPPVALSYSNMQFGGDLNFWSQALGGQVRIPLQNCSFAQGGASCSAPTGSSNVIFYTEDAVYPGDSVPATLTCFNNCPQAPTTDGMDPTSPTTMTYADNYSPGFAGHTYTFTSSVLKDSGHAGNPVLLTTAPTNQPWGFNSGPLVDVASYGTQLDCGNNSGQVCGWKAWSLPVFYTWETGPNNWNQLTVVNNGTAVVKFDPPARVTYVHKQSDTTAPDYKYNNVSFFMDYSGFGQLNGIPGKCFDPISGTETLDCSGNKRWVPEFTIPSGSTVSEGSATYYVKALESEQRMKPVSNGCTATLPATALTLPSVSEAVDPGLGAVPAASEVKYIGGVKQGAKTTTKTLSSWLLGF